MKKYKSYAIAMYPKKRIPNNTTTIKYLLPG